MKLGELKRQFLEYTEIEKGRSLKTIENYDRYLSKFLQFAKTENPKDITDEMLREYRLWLNRQIVPNGNKETIKKKTQNYYLIALRAFLKYLQKRGVEALSPERIELAKVSERSLDLISHQELERLMEAPLSSKTKGPVEELKKLRDKAILELLFSTGLRVSELCSLNADLDLSSEELSVRGKGEKIRVVFISKDAKDTLKTYLNKRGDMDEALFINISKSNSDSKRLTPRSVERIVKYYAIKAGITRKVSPHVIRHSFATDLLSNGADLRSVQALLGHANISTTQVYTHVTDTHLRDVHRAFHGKRRK